MQPWHGSRTRLRNSNSCERPRARLRITPGPYGPTLAVGRARAAAGEGTDGPDGTPTVGPSIPLVGLNNHSRSSPGPYLQGCPIDFDHLDKGTWNFCLSPIGELDVVCVELEVLLIPHGTPWPDF